jgi:hypothetical protein
MPVLGQKTAHVIHWMSTPFPSVSVSRRGTNYNLMNTDDCINTTVYVHRPEPPMQWLPPSPPFTPFKRTMCNVQFAGAACRVRTIGSSDPESVSEAVRGGGEGPPQHLRNNQYLGAIVVI